MPPKKPSRKCVETLTHDEARRVNIPTAELSAVARLGDITPVAVAFARRDADLDPQLIWRGKYGPDAIGRQGVGKGVFVIFRCIGQHGQGHAVQRERPGVRGQREVKDMCKQGGTQRAQRIRFLRCYAFVQLFAAQPGQSGIEKLHGGSHAFPPAVGRATAVTRPPAVMGQGLTMVSACCASSTRPAVTVPSAPAVVML